MEKRKLEVPKFPAWNEADSAASLQAIYDFAEKQVHSTIDRYFKRKGWRAAGAKVLRFGAIMLIGLYSLIPITRALYGRRPCGSELNRGHPALQSSDMWHSVSPRCCLPSIIFSVPLPAGCVL
jgi:hypothetical protein